VMSPPPTCHTLCLHVALPIQLSGAAQNLAAVCLRGGEVARARGDETTAQRRFAEAAASVRESLRICEELGNQPAAASSHGLLARSEEHTSELQALDHVCRLLL